MGPARACPVCLPAACVSRALAWARAGELTVSVAAAGDDPAPLDGVCVERVAIEVVPPPSTTLVYEREVASELVVVTAATERCAAAACVYVG